MSSGVVITGIGFSSCIGIGKDRVLESLREMKHGFSRSRLAGESSGPELVSGQVEGFDVSSDEARDWQFPGADQWDPGFLRGLPPHGPYACVALSEAMQQSALSPEALRDGRTGLYCASPGSPRALHHHLNRLEASDWQRSDPLSIVKSVAGTLNFNLASHYGITGSNCGFVSACTSSSHALGFAFDEIASGRQDTMLVVAAEDGNAESLLPFQGMRALSSNLDPDTASRPFDRHRDGFVGAAGGAALVLESRSTAEERKVRPLAEMVAWGQASDGHNVAAPHPEGRGIQAAMAQCLKAASIEAAQIDWINAHATSTPAGDRAEAIAIGSLPFSQALVSSTKGLTGHGLSFAGALEAAICVLCLDENLIPGNAALAEPDPACDGLRLPTVSESKNHFRFVLNNSSGFGGSNVSHLFARPSSSPE